MKKVITYLIMLALTGLGIYLTTLSVSGIEHYAIMGCLLIITGSDMLASVVGLVRTMVCFNVVELIVLLILLAGNIYSLVKFFA